MADSLLGRPVRSLFVAAFATEAVYLAATIRLPWWRYGGRLTSWSRILGGEAGSKGAAWLSSLAACFLGVLILVCAYVLGWRLVRAGVLTRRSLWFGAVLFSVTLFWLLPLTSDLFGYLGQAHLFTDLGANPLATSVRETQADALLQAYSTPYVSRPSAYGPAWVLLSSLGTAGKSDLVVGLLYLKGLALFGFLLSVWLVQQIASEVKPTAATEATYLFAWNPLVLLMAVGGGHNDIIMMAAVLLAGWLLLRKRWAMAAGALTLSVWTKYVSAIFIPLFMLCVIQAGAFQHWTGDRQSQRRRGWIFRVARSKAGESTALARLLETTEGLVGAARGQVNRPLLSSLASMVGVTALVLVPFGWPEWLAGALARFLRPANWQHATPDQAASALIPGLVLFLVIYVLVVVRYARGSRTMRHLGGRVTSENSSSLHARAWRLSSRQEIECDTGWRGPYCRLMDAGFVVALSAFVFGAARSQPWHLIWPATLAGLTVKRWAWPAVAALSVVMLGAQIWIEWGAPGL